MLLGNISVLHKSPAMYQTGTSGFGDRANAGKSGQLRAWGDNTALDWSKTALPLGYGPGGAWMLPTKAGNMVARQTARVTIDAAATGELGVNATGTATVTLGATATGALVADASGSAAIAIAATATAEAVLAANGSASISISATSGIGALASGSGAAQIIIGAAGTPSAIGTMSGIAYLAGEAAAVTPVSLAEAVWSAAAASFNVAGTFGNKLNAAGSAGDPWGTVLPAGYLAGTAGDMLAAMFRLQGLVAASPLVVTPTTRVAGDISQTVSQVGDTVTVTRI